ncbi:hypothetical protein [uncultured Methylobacterium sp.]|jgi:hypothetical protein|uniref:hypothetical protein n=1 Tax=uncultured Methylobacterium sp. TaxID=157278 RepID=UPI00258C3EEF|nr:hypothetical protein [uncultured Methylobacterium sp.]
MIWVPFWWIGRTIAWIVMGVFGLFVAHRAENDPVPPKAKVVEVVCHTDAVTVATITKGYRIDFAQRAIGEDCYRRVSYNQQTYVTTTVFVDDIARRNVTITSYAGLVRDIEVTE